jgi:hypothetical protein
MALRHVQRLQHLDDQQSTCKLIHKKCKRHDGAVMNRVRVGAEKLEHFCVMPASNVDGTSVIPTAPHETISIPCMIVHAPRRPLCLCRPHDSIPRSFAQSHYPASLVSHEPFCLPLAMT